MTTALWHDENDYLAVTFYADASVEIVDKLADVRWNMGRVALQEDGPIDVGHVWLRTSRSICEQFPGRFRGEVQGDTLCWTVLGHERKPIGQFSCSVRLDGPWLELRIVAIDDALPSLVFPPPIESESLVLPMGVGRWVKEPLPDRHFWVYPAHLNMRWFGGLRGENGWMAVIHEGAADAGVLATGMSLSAGWLKSLGRWPELRTLRYRFTQGGYVGLARTYRQYAIEHGLYQSLHEKMEVHPPLRNLLGGRMISFMQANSHCAERFEDRLQPPPQHVLSGNDLHVFCSHRQVQHALDEMRRLGLECGIVNIRGWIDGGYDETHPDIWPPDPRIGSLDELQQLVGLPDPLLTVLHDNYQDIYEQSASWPRGVNRSGTGAAMTGGQWAGGQAYILNSRDSLAYAKRNWEQIKTLSPRGMFIDTTTAVQFYESYEPGNELTRVQDYALKVELLRFYREQAQVLGSEEGADWGVRWVDWIENRHARVAGQSIPLWPLVFHDAVFNLRYTPGPLAPESTTSAAPHFLTDMLWGYPLIWGVREFEHWQTQHEQFASTFHVDRWIGRIGTDDMLEHRYLTDDGNVEQTVFSSGVAITVNFGAEPQTVDGVSVSPHNFVVRD